jgi:hypothetical protein
LHAPALDKGKPSARVGRKAMGPSWVARLPKDEVTEVLRPPRTATYRFVRRPDRISSGALLLAAPEEDILIGSRGHRPAWRSSLRPVEGTLSRPTVSPGPVLRRVLSCLPVEHWPSPPGTTGFTGGTGVHTFASHPAPTDRDGRGRTECADATWPTASRCPLRHRVVSRCASPPSRPSGNAGGWFALPACFPGGRPSSSPRATCPVAGPGLVSRTRQQAPFARASDRTNPRTRWFAAPSPSPAPVGPGTTEQRRPRPPASRGALASRGRRRPDVRASRSSSPPHPSRQL